MTAPVEYTPKVPCAICGRREGEVVVTLEDAVAEVCSTCFERAEDERARFDPWAGGHG